MMPSKLTVKSRRLLPSYFRRCALVLSCPAGLMVILWRECCCFVWCSYFWYNALSCLTAL